MVKGILGKLGIYVLGGFFTLASGCSLNGIPLAKEYPPFNEENKKALEEKILNAHELDLRVVDNVEDYPEVIVINEKGEEEVKSTIAFEDGSQEWINRLMDFQYADYELQDIKVRGKGSLEFVLVPDSEVRDLCGPEAAACHNFTYNAIIMPNNWPVISFLGTSHHEIGHFLYPGNDEFPSKCNEIYWPIKAYQFSKPIGSLMINYSINGVITKPFHEQSGFSAKYTKAKVFAIANLIYHNSDIEKAMDFVLYEPKEVVETLLYDEMNLEEYEGMDNSLIHFLLWNELLGSDFFISEMTGDTGHLSPNEAWELRDFMKIKNYKFHLNKLPDKEEVEEELMPNKEDAEKELVQLLEDFAFNPNYTNPYFRAEVVNSLTPYFYIDMLDAAQRMYAEANDSEDGRVSPETIEEYYSLGKKIITINKPYPCRTENPYECPPFARGIKDSHVDSYDNLSLSFYRFDDEKKRAITNYAIEFVEKFYPGADISTNCFGPINVEQKETNNYLPYVVFNPAVYALHYDKDLAKNLFIAGVTVECMEKGLGHPKYLCINIQNTMWGFLETNWGITK